MTAASASLVRDFVVVGHALVANGIETRAANEIPGSPVESEIDVLVAVVLAVIVQIQRTSVVRGNGVAGSEESEHGVQHWMNRQQDAHQMMRERALENGLKRMHGVLAECSRVEERVMILVYILPTDRCMQESVTPIEERVHPQEVDDEIRHEPGQRVIALLKVREIWRVLLDQEKPGCRESHVAEHGHDAKLELALDVCDTFCRL